MGQEDIEKRIARSAKGLILNMLSWDVGGISRWRCPQVLRDLGLRLSTKVGVEDMDFFVKSMKVITETRLRIEWNSIEWKRGELWHVFSSGQWEPKGVSYLKMQEAYCSRL